MLNQANSSAGRAEFYADLPDFSGVDPAAAEGELAELLAACRASLERHLEEGAAQDWSLVSDEVECDDAVERFWSVISHLHAVADNEELRAAYNACRSAMTSYSNWRQHNESLREAYLQLKDSECFGGLEAEQRRLVELELRDFHLAGVDLHSDAKKQYREIVHRLSDLGARFAQNLLDATQAWQLHLDDAERLSGLPDSELNLLRGLARAQDKSGYLVNLGFPAYSAVMKHAEDRELRREVHMAYSTRASDQGPNAGEWDNTDLVGEILSLRHQLARLLGFEQYVDLALATRMAEHKEDVESFLWELAARAKSAAAAQLAELEEFAAGNGAPVPLKSWDITFWSERLRNAELELSDEELKPYFTLDGMLGALFYVVERLFGLRLVHDADVDSWHEDVRFYWLEEQSGQRIGGIYLDLYVRRSKRDGAWMDICRSRRRTDQGVQMPVAYLNCNFSPPVKNQPSLLTHEEVRTLFHEAGHCLHHLLTTVDWPQINGTHNVEWDAIELPSQLLENWAWDPEVLSRFARHFETGEALPTELHSRMERARHFQKALILVKQLEYAMVDFRLHSEYEPDAPPDPRKILDEVRDQIAVVPAPPENRFLNSFSHIFGGGYSAGYYSYLWAEELSEDAWGRFRSSGAFDPVSGEALRKEILAVGGSRPAMDSFIAFRGRKPVPGPLLESYGLEVRGQSKVPE
jgi:oligopeptidase A